MRQLLTLGLHNLKRIINIVLISDGLYTSFINTNANINNKVYVRDYLKINCVAILSTSKHSVTLMTTSDNIQ